MNRVTSKKSVTYRCNDCIPPGNQTFVPGFEVNQFLINQGGKGKVKFKCPGGCNTVHEMEIEADYEFEKDLQKSIDELTVEELELEKISRSNSPVKDSNPTRISK